MFLRSLPDPPVGRFVSLAETPVSPYDPAMSIGRTVAKNALLLTGATTLTKVVAFASFILVARFAGRDVTGTYFFGVSVTSMVVTLTDLGLTPVLIRAIAGHRPGASRLIGLAWRLKALFIPIGVLAALGYGVLKGVNADTMATIAVATAVMSADAVHLLLYGMLRGKQKLQPEAIGMFVGQLLTAIAAVSVAWAGWGPAALAGALFLGSIWNVGWAWLQAARLGLKIQPPEPGEARSLLREAAPFAISGLAVKVYSYVDSLMLHAYHGEGAVGLYAVAYKMTYALQFLPLTFSAALYPALAAAWAKKDHANLRDAFRGSLRLMAVIGFPLSAGLSGFAPRLVPFLFGEEFFGAIGAMAVLPWVLLPIFMDFPVGSFLNASHRAHLKTAAMLGTMVVNVVLNALLVPSMGPVGAAWAGVFSFWCLYAFGMTLTARDAGGFGVQASILARAVLSAGIVWFAIRELGAIMPLPAAIIFAGAAAIVCAFATRLLTVADVRQLLGWRNVSTEAADESEPHVQA